MDLEVARSFLIALLIGALVGIDRERKKAAEPGSSFGGLRTHILIALAGAASARIAMQWQWSAAFVVTLAVVGAAVVASYVHQNLAHAEQEDVHGLTSEMAALAVFLLAAMVMLGDAALAVALAVFASAVLTYKQPLRGAARRLDAPDLRAGLKLLIATFIVLPLLPDTPVDPFGAINPYRLGLLVILISALSLAGYVAVRWLGSTHGNAITGLAGGLVSSTAATVSLARSSRAEAAPDPAGLTAGILLSWLVMLLRVLGLVAVVNPRLLPTLWPPALAMAGVTAVFAAGHYRAGLAAAGQGAPTSIRVENPFSLTAAVRFGALFAVVLLVVRLAERHGPAHGVYLVAALAGSVDVDAIALSLAQSSPAPPEAAGWARASVAITVAMLANTAVKCGIVLAVGADALHRRVAWAAAAIGIAGALALALG